jgi:hypothetical protein
MKLLYGTEINVAVEMSKWRQHTVEYVAVRHNYVSMS